MKRIYTTLLLAAAMFGGFMLAASVAYAADPVGATGPESLSDLFRAVADAFRGGNPTLGGALAVVAGVTLIRKYGPLKYPWLNKTPWPGLLVLLLAFPTTVAAMLTSGSSFTATLWPALKLAGMAAGGYSLVAHLGSWVLEAWGSKLPAWLKFALGRLLWMFKKPGEAEIKKAEAEAATAVESAGEPRGAGDADEVP